MKSVLVSVLVLVVLFLSFSCNEGYDYSQAALGLGFAGISPAQKPGLKCRLAATIKLLIFT